MVYKSSTSNAGSAGTVTNVTFTGDGVVLSSTPSAPVTLSGTLQATLANANALTVLGNPTGTPAAPIYTTDPVVSGAVTGNTLVSTVATGTAPLVVSSTTQVANLNAATAGSASQVAVVDDAVTNANMFITFVSATGGNESLTTSSTKLFFNPSTGAAGITASTAATGLTIAGVTSGIAFSANTVTSGTALQATNVSTGTGVNLTGITTGVGINATATTTGKGFTYNTTAATATTSGAINITGSAAMTADYSGSIVTITPTKTMTTAATRLVSGLGHVMNANPVFSITGTLASVMTVSSSMINFSRTISNASSSASSSMNMQADLVTITNTKGTATNAVVDSGRLLALNQANATASGNVVDITNAGSGAAINIVSGTTALNANNLTMTGSIAQTGARVTKGWFTDLEITNLPTSSGVAIPTISSTSVITNKDLTSGTNTFPIFNQNTSGSAAKWTTARLLAGNSTDGSANVPFANKFIVQGTADTGLSGAQFLGSLGTGLVKNTTTTGILSAAVSGTDYSAGTSALTTGILKSTTTTGALTIAVAADFPTLNQNTSGNAATVTTNANLSGPISSVGNTTSITSQTGTGTKFVVDTSPTLITPILGVAAATSINFGGTNPLATYSSGTWTPTWTGLTVVGTPTYQGTWTKIGRIVFCTLRVSSTTTTTSIANTTNFTGLPFTSAESSTMTGVTTNNVTSVGVGYVDSSASYTPSWSAVNGVMLSFSYIATTN